MNLQRSDDELWFESQQIEAARLDDDKRAQNPFAAAAGIAGTIAFVMLPYLLWRIVVILISMVHSGAERASFLFNTVYSFLSLGKAAFEPYAMVLFALIGMTICIVAYRSLSWARSAIAAFAWRRRA